MALIKCPECGKEVSDRAGKCIYCGYPFHHAQVNQVKEEFLCTSRSCGFSYVFVGVMAFMAIGYFFMGGEGTRSISFICAVIAIGAFLSFQSKSIRLSNKAVYIRKGFFTTEKAGIPLNQVSSISDSRNLLGKMFNYGSLTITCADKTYRMDMMNHTKELKSTFIKVESGMNWRTF